MNKCLQIITTIFIFSAISVIGLEFITTYDNRVKHLQEMELLAEQKKTCQLERYRYEKQIELLLKELENEKLKNHFFTKLK